MLRCPAFAMAVEDELVVCVEVGAPAVLIGG
jgi:hypothetical protein